MNIQADATKCLAATQHFKASVHWTLNTLPKEAKPYNEDVKSEYPTI